MSFYGQAEFPHLLFNSLTMFENLIKYLFDFAYKQKYAINLPSRRDEDSIDEIVINIKNKRTEIKTSK